MTNTSFQPGDYIQPIGSSKIFFVKSIIEKGIVIERVDAVETSRFFVGRTPMVINFDEIETKFKFTLADESNWVRVRVRARARARGRGRQMIRATIRPHHHPSQMPKIRWNTY